MYNESETRFVLDNLKIPWSADKCLSFPSSTRVRVGGRGGNAEHGNVQEKLVSRGQILKSWANCIMKESWNEWGIKQCTLSALIRSFRCEESEDSRVRSRFPS
ncbi:hypothetical protein M413DRAFT_442074 [Hebeloma cylindrosporum]|uniref:Uncharacterized protein n=1 Tax=Hebeloma cylindrosporum TaxID=76867 RepID=A0A0C2YWM4_HEBCY|nr:hypothetical protein M413DRAFT_442074 [Hebeloma cylindrosporum h7]